MGLLSDADFWWGCESGGGVFSALHHCRHFVFCSLKQGLTSPASRAFIPPHLCNQRIKPVLWQLSRSISTFPSLQHLGAGVLYRGWTKQSTQPRLVGYFIFFYCGCSWPSYSWPAAPSPSLKLLRQPQPATERLQQSFERWGSRKEKRSKPQSRARIPGRESRNGWPQWYAVGHSHPSLGTLISVAA